jgi:hypothetical protein
MLKTTFLRKNYNVEGFCGLIETEETAAAVSLKPQNPYPWSN